MALILLEQPYGNIDDWTASYGGEDKQALFPRRKREIIKTLSFRLSKVRTSDDNMAA